MYCATNFKTKKALREAVASGEAVRYYQAGPFGGGEVQDGTITLEGPHYPAPHTWYASATVKGGLVVALKR
jgi:hypothetical protein